MFWDNQFSSSEMNVGMLLPPENLWQYAYEIADLLEFTLISDFW